MAACAMRPPVQCGPLCKAATCAVWPHVQCGPAATCAVWRPVRYGHLCGMTARAIWPPVQYGHLCNMATRAVWPPVQHGRLCNMAGCAIRPPVRYGHLCDTATCAIRPVIRLIERRIWRTACSRTWGSPSSVSRWATRSCVRPRWRRRRRRTRRGGGARRSRTRSRRRRTRWTGLRLARYRPSLSLATFRGHADGKRRGLDRIGALSDATLRFDLALGVRRRHAPKFTQNRVKKRWTARRSSTRSRRRGTRWTGLRLARRGPRQDTGKRRRLSTWSARAHSRAKRF